MNIAQIEEIVKKLASDIIANEVSNNEFIYKLMAAYGHRKTTIGRIKSGERNLANVEDEVRAKRHIYFKQSQSDCVLSDIDNMKKEPSVARDKIRFVIATDFNQFVALDTRTHDTLDIEFTELGKYFDFFLPWAGMEKAVYQGENPADVKAAEKMAKLFDLIKADNFSEENKDDTTALHNLNVFLTRLLFCFFAEDTGIFKQNQFSAELESHTKVDGSDVDGYLNRLFEVLNTSKDNRGDLPDYLSSFEYVNGGLFANTIASPRFSTKSRKMLIECGSELDWSDINPDIFGSMIQAVVHPDQRGGMGMHYTSVTNIMKVIEPLFLDEIYAELENIEDNIDVKLRPSRLRKLHDRIAEIKIFDPACGSGNFLIIAFKELRKLEMEIIKRLQELEQNDNQDDLFDDVGLDSSFSRIQLSQFYGIELDDFAHEVAILSLWLAAHQMNVEFRAEFGECEPSLPLRESGNITNGNAALLNWEEYIGSNSSEVFILGNPPYLGASLQSDEQKHDMEFNFKAVKGYKNLDYISIWFFKAARLNERFTCNSAFVTTSSLFQGEQILIMWPILEESEVDITFSYQPFLWKNNAKDNAAVTCVIVGVGNKSKKFVYTDTSKLEVKNINPYLLPSARNTIIYKRSKPLAEIPNMTYGSKPTDGGNLILTSEERENLLKHNSSLTAFLKKYVGASEYTSGRHRYCLWIEDGDLDKLKNEEEIIKRIENVRNFRLSSKKEATKKLAVISHRFAEPRYLNLPSIVVPIHGSERRKYIPFGMLSNDTVASNAVQVIYTNEIFVLGLISSYMHNIWIKTVCGKIKGDPRYSSSLGYNTFPVPPLSSEAKAKLAEATINLLAARENFPERALSELYDPDVMPSFLIQAHNDIDALVDEIYGVAIESDDIVRLEALFNLYDKMTGGQNA